MPLGTLNETVNTVPCSLAITGFESQSGAMPTEFLILPKAFAGIGTVQFVEENEGMSQPTSENDPVYFFLECRIGGIKTGSAAAATAKVVTR